MKSLVLLFHLTFFTLAAIGQTSSLAVTFKFAGIEEGYDHICKTQVWVDDELIGESGEVNESKGASFTVNVPVGEHSLRLINLAYYEGEWEEHTIENNYSIDCLWEGTHALSKKSQKVFMLFDINDTTTVSWKKMPKPAKK
jgi:hypothetical protein